jgi:hypothetical protein
MELLRQIESPKNSLQSCAAEVETRALRQQLSDGLTSSHMRMERKKEAANQPIRLSRVF